MKKPPGRGEERVGSEVHQYLRCSAHSRTATQVQVGKSTEGDGKDPCLCWMGQPVTQKPELLSKCSVLGMPSVWPGKLQPRIGITVILPAHSAKFSQKHAGKAALLESLPLPFICRLSMRASRRGMETSGPSSPSSAQGCQMESCPFRGEHSNRRAARLSWNVSCASLYNVAALSSSKESKQRNFSSVTSVPPFRHLAGSRRGDLWAYTSLPFLSLPAWKEGT